MKARKIKESAFDAMETIINVLTNAELDESSQLTQVKNIAYMWAMKLKELINE